MVERTACKETYTCTDISNLDLEIETCFHNRMDVRSMSGHGCSLHRLVCVGSGGHHWQPLLRKSSSKSVWKQVEATPSHTRPADIKYYAKLLRTVFAALSYTFLEYPNNS